MRILFALLGVLTGLALVFGGYRLARVILPIWGFLAGLSLGGAVIADMANTPFLGTVLGVTIGVAMGLIFALFAYLYYAAAVIVLAGALGYWLGSSFMLFLGLDRGLLSTLVGLAAGIAVGMGALFANIPKYFLIVLTSIAGGVITVGSFLLLFNNIPLDAFSYTAAKITIAHSAWWSIVTFALAAFGMLVQTMETRYYEFEEWGVGDTHHLPPTTHAPQVQH